MLEWYHDLLMTAGVWWPIQFLTKTCQQWSSFASILVLSGKLVRAKSQNTHKKVIDTSCHHQPPKAHTLKWDKYNITDNKLCFLPFCFLILFVPPKLPSLHVVKRPVKQCTLINCLEVQRQIKCTCAHAFLLVCHTPSCIFTSLH